MNWICRSTKVASHSKRQSRLSLYWVIRNDCRSFNNLSYTIYLRQQCMYFLLIEQQSKFLLHTLQVLYMCSLCDSTNINTIIKFVPNCLQHVSGDDFIGGSDSYLQFRDTCGKRRNINLILDVTPQKEITWGCIWRRKWQVVKTPTIISNNPVCFNPVIVSSHHSHRQSYLTVIIHYTPQSS